MRGRNGSECVRLIHDLFESGEDSFRSASIHQPSARLAHPTTPRIVRDELLYCGSQLLLADRDPRSHPDGSLRGLYGLSYELLVSGVGEDQRGEAETGQLPARTPAGGDGQIRPRHEIGHVRDRMEDLA